MSGITEDFISRKIRQGAYRLGGDQNMPPNTRRDGFALTSRNGFGGAVARRGRTGVVDYFGFTDTGSLTVDQHFVTGYRVRAGAGWAGTTAITCPGSGARTVVSLQMWIRRSGGVGSVVTRLALYTTDSNPVLVLQGDASVEVTNSSYDWIGHTLFAPSSPTLTGGTPYILAFSVTNSGATEIQYQKSTLGSGVTYLAGDATSGFPDLFGSGGTTISDRFAFRIGVVGGSNSTDTGTIIGDSTVAAYSGYSPVSQYVLYSNASPIINFTTLATPGDTISQQKDRWLMLSSNTRAGMRWVVLQVGLNDTDYTESAATALARYQSLLDTIKADAPSARVYTSTMTPCKARLISLYGGSNGAIAYQKWLDMNDAMSGNSGSGYSAITGMYGVISSHTASLNDGSGNLAAAYDSGDGIHENNAGREIVGDAWSAKLISDGTIP
jgi:lysophospholipase L1-like esterase